MSDCQCVFVVQQHKGFGPVARGCCVHPSVPLCVPLQVFPKLIYYVFDFFFFFPFKLLLFHRKKSNKYTIIEIGPQSKIPIILS